MTTWSYQSVSRADTGIVGPTLFITGAAWDLMQMYVRSEMLGNNEINGVGFVTETADGNFIMDHVVISKQTVTTGTADNTQSDLAKAQYEAVRLGRPDDLRVQWHSHVQGDAYHSYTDMASIERFAEYSVKWFISLVTNQHGEATARFDQFEPRRLGGPIEVTVIRPIDPAVQAGIEAEVARKVTIQKPKKVARGYSNGFVASHS